MVSVLSGLLLERLEVQIPAKAEIWLGISVPFVYYLESLTELACTDGLSELA